MLAYVAHHTNAIHRSGAEHELPIPIPEGNHSRYDFRDIVAQDSDHSGAEYWAKEGAESGTDCHSTRRKCFGPCGLGSLPENRPDIVPAE
jgi:hypothetical protein